MAKHLQNIFVVAAATLGSRVLGLARDVVALAFFGASALNSGFVFAFQLPNLFRRLLGEGALTSAFIPMLSEAEAGDGRAAAFQLLNQVLTRLVTALAGIIVVGMAALAAAARLPDLAERWRWGFELGLILLPYVLLVCVAAALAAALNLFGRFAVPALSQVWLNTAMIVSLAGFGWWLGKNDAQRMYWQCGGVLAGGVLQVLIPAAQLRREGWRPHWDWSRSPRLDEMRRLFLPGLFGASVTQINVFVSGCLALWLNDAARTVLYVAARLLELPLGMFTIAVVTVLFPNLALLATQGDREALGRAYAQGLRLIFAITVPAALGLVVLREPIVRLLFAYGKFGAEPAALEETALVVAISALGLPLLSLATFATRGFHALKDTRTPSRVAAWVFAANIILSLPLMLALGTPGLALANLLTAGLQCRLLQRRLFADGSPLARPDLARALRAIGLAGAGLVVFTLAGWWGLRTALGPTRWADLAAVGGLIPAAMLVYFALLRAAQFEDWEQVRAIFAHAVRPRG